jgi:hypothetical protein
MTPKRSDEVLSEWSAVTRTATPPGPPSKSVAPRAGGVGISLAGVGLLAIGLVVALAWLGNRDSRPGVGDTTPPIPSPTISSPAATQSANATATPSPSPTATLGPCSHLSTPLSWEGAAGQRIATITVTNGSDGTCVINGITHVQYVDAGNHVLIDGPVPTGAGTLTVAPHSSVTTMVEIGNYCGPAPEQPVGIAFTDGDRKLLLIGSPASQADMSVPPCNGPAQPGSIQMHPWSGA